MKFIRNIALLAILIYSAQRMQAMAEDIEMNRKIMKIEQLMQQLQPHQIQQMRAWLAPEQRADRLLAYLQTLTPPQLDLGGLQPVYGGGDASAYPEAPMGGVFGRTQPDPMRQSLPPLHLYHHRGPGGLYRKPKPL